MRGRLSGICTVFVVIVGFAVMTSNAMSSPLFSQTPSSYFGGFDSDTDVSQFVYDDFTLSNDSTINSVTWRGEYSSLDSISATDDFTIAVFQDTGLSGTAALGSQIASFDVGNAVNRTDTGIDVYGRDLFEYTATLAGGLALDAGMYWLAIVDSTESDPNNSWIWIKSESGSDFLVGHTFGTASFLGTGSFAGDNYFILDGELGKTPLPATLSLFLTMLAGIGGLRWWRRKVV